MKDETKKQEQPEPLVKGPQLELDFESDEPLACTFKQDESGFVTCESCQ